MQQKNIMTSPVALRRYSAGRQGPRVALYSHDTVGLGHVRRNLLIAQALAASDVNATCLMISGTHEANFFSLPAGVDCLTLPRICKDARGDYASARLDLSVEKLSALRQGAISSALEQFEPDILIVDKVPAGVGGELLPALDLLKRSFQTRCVLGLRDILDDAEAVRADWLCRQNVKAIEQFFDSVWVYGDPHVYDPIHEYGLPDSISKKTSFTGYLHQGLRLTATQQADNGPAGGRTSPSANRVVCTVGGGQDGAKLIETFVEAVTPEMDAVVLTGPYLPQPVIAAAKAAAAGRSNLQIVEFAPEADELIAQADCVVGMAGYNTVCSILTFRRRALLVPRLTPRREQWIRAERLQQLKLVEVLPPEQMSAGRLRDWLRHPRVNGQGAWDAVDIDGLERIIEAVRTLAPGAAGPVPVAAGVLQP